MKTLNVIFLLYMFCWEVNGTNHTKRQIHYVARRQDPLSKGPVLFPADTSPPPRNPLIVTSRPLAEQISRSDLVLSTKRPYWAQQNEISLDEYDDLYRPGPRQPSRTNSSHPYAAVASKLRQLLRTKDTRGYSSYEQQTVLPPIYRALGNFAKSKVLNNNNRYIKSRPIPVKSSKKSKPIKNDGEDDDYYNDNLGNEAKQYAFSYSVKDHQTGDDFSHSQRHSGSATNGEYRVKLPDGRLQIVSYTADNGGYKAEVRYQEDDEEEEDPRGSRDDLADAYRRIVDQGKEPGRFTSSGISNQGGYSLPATTSERSKEELSNLGRIVVPSREEDYDDYYYYDDKPREVLITSKPTYIHTTPAPFQQQGAGVQYDFVVSTTPSTPIASYDISDRNLKAGQVRYTTVAPIVYSARPLQLVNYFDYRK